MAIDTQTVIRKAPHVVSRTVGETVALLDVNSGEYYSIDEVGVIVMREAAEGATIAKIAEAVAAEYDISADEAAQDIIDLATELQAEGLIEVQ